MGTHALPLALDPWLLFLVILLVNCVCLRWLYRSRVTTPDRFAVAVGCNGALLLRLWEWIATFDDTPRNALPDSLFGIPMIFVVAGISWAATLSLLRPRRADEALRQSGWLPQAGLTLLLVSLAFLYSAHTQRAIRAEHDSARLRSFAASRSGQLDGGIMRALAANTNTPPDTLGQLAKRGGPSVRQALAANPAAPTILLEQLSGDRHVWRALAVNPNASPKLVDELTPVLLASLAASDEEGRANAAHALRRSPGTPAVIAALNLAAQSDASAQVREHATTALTWIAASAVATVKDDPALVARRRAVQGRPRAELIPAYAKALHDTDREVRSGAISALLALPHSDAALSAIGEFLLVPEPSPTKQQKLAFMAVEKAGPAALPVLIELARLGNTELSSKACLLLAALGDDALPALTAANEMLRSQDEDRGSCASTLLGHLDAAAVPSLIEALQDRNPRVRWRAALTLKLIGASAKDAVPRLKTLTVDPDPEVKTMARAAITAIDAREDNQFRPRALRSARR